MTLEIMCTPLARDNEFKALREGRNFLVDAHYHRYRVAKKYINKKGNSVKRKNKNQRAPRGSMNALKIK